MLDCIKTKWLSWKGPQNKLQIGEKGFLKYNSDKI